MAQMHTIALVDDDRETRNTVSKALKAEGYEIVTYTDSASALDGLEVSPPDLVILDVTMPRTDEEKLSALHEKLHIPVLVLASRDQKVSRKFASIVKPFEARHLVAQIVALLEEIGETTARVRSDAAPVRKREPVGVRQGPKEFALSDPLVGLFHARLLEDYGRLPRGSLLKTREKPSFEHARTILRGRILEVIASRALRMQAGVLDNNPLSVGGEFDGEFAHELSQHVCLQTAQATQFFSQLHEDLVADLKEGGSIAGRWGRLVFANDQIVVATKDAGKLARTDDSPAKLS